MGPMKVALLMMKKEYKKTFFYAFTLVVTVAIVFLFFCFAHNPYIKAMVGSNINEYGEMIIPFSTVLSMVMIVLSILAACFSNTVYLSKKINEIAIEQISGGNITEIVTYLIAQNFTVGAIAIPLGLLIGFIGNPMLNSYLYPSLHITDGLIWYVDSEAIILTCLYIFIEVIAITFINSGFVYRHNILELLHVESSIKPLKPRANFRLPSFLSYILVVLPFAIWIRGNIATPTEFAIYSLIGIYGVYGLYHRGLAELISKIQTKFKLSHAIDLIALGNLKYSIVKTKSLVIIILFSINALIGYSINYIKDPANFIIIYISYVTCVILMTLMIFYKIILENDSHAHIFGALHKLGYTNNQINKIIKKEVFYYYFLMLFFISIYALPILIYYTNTGLISVTFSIQTFLIYFIPISVSGVLAYYNYKATVFNSKED